MALHIALFGNKHQSRKNRYVPEILVKLTSLGVLVSIEEDYASFLQHELGISVSAFSLFNTAAPVQADIAISVGGDGTFLGTAACVGPQGIPILGINTGHLGFLADISPENIAPSLEALCRGDYVVESRRALQVSVDGALCRVNPYALNEVAVLKHDNSSLIEVKAFVGSHFLASYLADGLIVATPTGSTGYSLSVGGPILVPQSGTLCVSPIAPHSLSVRPVVVRDDDVIKLHVSSRSGHFLLASDGRSESHPHSSIVTIERAPHDVQVVKVEHKDFFATLREKMSWGYDRRY